jgi:polysaccharide biosynthesis/export protein
MRSERRRPAAAAALIGCLASGAAPGARQAAIAPTAQGAESVAPATAPPAIGETAWLNGRYRITPSDVLEISFPYVPDWTQTVTVQPDGYVNLRGIGDIRAQGRTVPELKTLLIEAYAPILRDPVVTVVLREFEKPYYVTAGEVKQPGRFELRGPITVMQAIALAGGPVDGAKTSQVILFRRYTAELVEVKSLDIKKMLARRDLSEDQLLRPGDTVFVPRTLLSKLKPFLPTASIGFFLNPFQQ